MCYCYGVHSSRLPLLLPPPTVLASIFHERYTSYRIGNTSPIHQHPELNKLRRNTRCFLGQVPLEVLAEILGYTSPRDILAVARTSKYFCATLVNNAVTDTKYIWKRARKAYVPEIPEPLPNFTETSYAAFLFDKGECEACGKKCKTKYASFAIRLRLCDKTACRRSWLDTKAVQLVGYDSDRYVSILNWIPRVEYRDMGLPDADEVIPIIHNSAMIVLRKTDWNRAIDEYNKAALSDATIEKYIASKNKAVARYAKFAEHCRALVRWRKADYAATRSAHKANLEFSQEKATSQKWKLWDLIQSPTYGMLYRTKTISKERIKPSDFESILPIIEEELFDLQRTRKNKEEEASYTQRRNAVENHYRRLKGTNKRTAMPSLAEFRHLPTVQRQLYKSTNVPSATVAHELKHSKLVGQMIEEDLDRWVDAARTSLAAVLGFPVWKSVSVHKLHPVDRLTARFRCKRCDARGEPKKWEGGCFTFAEACQHRCKPGGKTRVKERWEAKAFVPDEKAINAIEQVLTFFEYGAEHVKSIEEAGALGPRISCMSCKARIVMDIDVLVRHCHRHEKTELRVAPESEIKDLAPLKPGLCAALAVRSNTAEEERKKRVYHCRHCDYPRILAAQDPEHMASTTAAAYSAESQDIPPGAATGKKKLKSYSFDGLRSHVKEKHGIQWIGDEDFYKAV